ncbi:MAG: hypothetical protein LBL79_09430 [Prevotella sp.]|jgi:hypothetical protein|nr:hypothetical protein [Prevotella sp.]
MKVKSYHVLYRIFSFLSDKSNGASIFVKYKLILGALLVGLTTVSCEKDKEEPEPEVTCYVAPNPENVQAPPASSQNTDTLVVSGESFNQEL